MIFKVRILECNNNYLNNNSIYSFLKVENKFVHFKFLFHSLFLSYQKHLSNLKLFKD